jgi:hypothetical protein
MSKKTLKQLAIVTGLSVLGILLFSFAPTAFAQLISPGDAPTRISAATGGQGSARQLILTILNFFLGFLGLLAVIMIIYGGILYVSAAGNQESIDKGKKIIMYAIIGLVVILLSFAIVNTVLGGAGTGTDV